MSNTVIRKIGDVAIDLSTVKSMRREDSSGCRYSIIMELKKRIEYVWNPQTQTWEKEILNDIIQIDYNNYTTADNYFLEWVEYWREYAEARIDYLN